MKRLLPIAFVAATPLYAQESFDCVIEPYMVLQVGAASEGIVDEIFMERGAQVKKGDVLAVLDSSVEAKTLELADAQASSNVGVDLALGRLDLAKKEHQRALELRNRNAGTQSDLDIAEAQMRQAELELLQARETAELQKLERNRTAAILERRTVRSPIDGVLLRRLIGPGEYVYSQAQIAQIATIDPLYVDVFLPSEMYNSIAQGQVASVSPAAPLDGVYEAEVIAIDQVFDAASDTFGVRLEMQNDGNALPAGVDCTIEFGGS